MASHHSTTNYAVNRPSYAYSGSTTEFDDALLKRGIVSLEQVLLAKGMSVSDAERLLCEEKETCGSKIELPRDSSYNKNDSSGDDCDDAEFDDDVFLEEYRQKRMLELQETAFALPTRRVFGDVVYIDRPEWTRHVNNDSMHAWIVVCLTSSNVQRTGSVEAAVKELATAYVTTKFVLIPTHSAIENWPEANLPSLFLYRHGSLQHELLRLPVDLTTEQLETILVNLTVLD